MKNRSSYIVGGIRTPFTKSMTGYSGVTTQELMTASLQALVEKYSLQGKQLGDVGLGAIMNSSMNWNLARECVLGTQLDARTPAYNVSRACGTSLEATIQMALKISFGQIDTAIAAGVDTNSDAPIMVSRSLTQKLLRLNSAKSGIEKMKVIASMRPSDLIPLAPAVVEPRTLMSMGQHCEKMVQEWKIDRRSQDQLSLESHQKGIKAYDEGFYNDLVFEFEGLKRDTFLRADTSLERLGKLKPAFDFTEAGTLTAGNSSPLTDGSSAVLLASEDGAKKENLPLLARFVDGEVAAVDYVHGAGLLMAPTIAVSKLLKRNELNFAEFDFFEIHEAFAGQVLCTLKAWESPDYCKNVLGCSSVLGPIDRTKMNVKGGSVAIGHPFAATGTRIVASLAKMLHEKGKGRGLISICTAGGMGVTAILEAV